MHDCVVCPFAHGETPKIMRLHVARGKISRIARGGTLQQWNAGKDYGVANRCGTWSYGNFIGIMYALARDALACHKESQGPRYIPGQAWHFIQQRSCLNVGDHVVEPVLFCDGRRLWNTQVGIYYAHARLPQTAVEFCKRNALSMKRSDVAEVGYCSKHTECQVWVSDLFCGSRSPCSRI